MEIPKSTVRLTQVVEKCGRPKPVTLWTDPKKDRDFQAAVHQNRVLTVIQETVGTRKDFGLVGFHRADRAAYWVFSKPLDAFNGKRVIGINYDWVEPPKPKDSVKLTDVPEKKQPPKQEWQPITQSAKESKAKPQPEKAKPKLHRYRVVIRSISTTENAREIEATSAKEAEEVALKMAAGETVKFSAEEIMRRVTGVCRL